MNYIVRHWRGELSVARASWLSGLLAFLVTLPTSLLELHLFFTANRTSIGDLIRRASDGELDFGALQSPPFFLSAFDQVLNFILLVWWSVGTWRSCNNPANDKEGKSGRGFLKFVIVAGFAFQFYDLFDFIGTSLAK